MKSSTRIWREYKLWLTPYKGWVIHIRRWVYRQIHWSSQCENMRGFGLEWIHTSLYIREDICQIIDNYFNLKAKFGFQSEWENHHKNSFLEINKPQNVNSFFQWFQAEINKGHSCKIKEERRMDGIGIQSWV